mgnify:CR=1 FL=1
MENKNAITLIDKILKNLDKTGFDSDTLIDDIKALRACALEEQIPLVVKVLRLSYEHIEANSSFLIPIPNDEPIEDDVAVETTDVSPVESFKYLMSLIKNLNNKANIADLKEYYISKHYADHWLVNNSSLDYTIVQPGALKERAGTGKITINDTSSGENAIEDVATTLASVLTADNTIGKVFNLHNGDIDINEAVATV